MDADGSVNGLAGATTRRGFLRGAAGAAGGLAPHSQGDPVLVHLPQDALRLLAASNGAVALAATTT